jgi:hypothetical protein
LSGIAFDCEINFSIFSAIIWLLKPELSYASLGVLHLPATGVSPQKALIHTPVHTHHIARHPQTTIGKGQQVLPI